MVSVTSVPQGQNSGSRGSSSDEEKHRGTCLEAGTVAESGPGSRSGRGLNSCVRVGLISYEELPAWHQDNPFIKHGYRPISHSTAACLRSWASLHNETLNIYTHLVPAVLALVVGETWVLCHLRRRYADAGASDYVVFALLLSAAAACLGISSAYHTLMSHSREVEARWLRLDFVGIVVLTLGSFVSGVYVAFWCESAERRIYWAMIASLAAVSAVVMVAPHFQGPRWRTFRLSVFVVTGLSGLAPIVHGICKFGFAQMARQSGLPYYLAEGGLFLIGAVTYASRFPERIKPGAFDIWGSSHQIFHVLVVIATVVHLVGVLKAYDYNYHNRQCVA
ncbi:mPR-like GPCR protein [Xylariaceae sp. FL0594]|nr:mPR-like GPCR protein [Xylariaceae sp. FL0594]